MLPLKEVLSRDGNVSGNVALKSNEEPPLVTADARSAIVKSKTEYQRPSSGQTSSWRSGWRVVEYRCNQSIPEMNKVRCFECVKVVPVRSCNDLEPGDHVVFCGVIYDHHGILISKDGESLEIAEVTNTVYGFLTGLLRGFMGIANIRVTLKKYDFKREKVCVVEYKHRYPKQFTIRRAKILYSEKEKTRNYNYNLFHNNCEHFATYCSTGKTFSVQVSKFTLMWDMFVNSGFLGLNNELARNIAQFEKHLICEDCYIMNRKLLGVSLQPIVSTENIKKGDVIRFSYWNFYHEAVVLDKEEKEQFDQNIVDCSVAHYAFCGLFSHRTIKKEMIPVRLDGQCFKLDYDSNPYAAYTPDEVVERARSRLGEQSFIFYSNDSSHFARWCKLKLVKETSD